MQPPPLPSALSVSAKEVRWPWMFSSAALGQSVTVSCGATDWFVRSRPWWLEDRRNGNELLLTPRNCGFHSGKVEVQHGPKVESIAVSAWILPNVWSAILGMAAGSAAALVPLAAAGALLVLSLLLGVFFAAGSVYVGGILGALPPLAALGLLMLGPLPLLMGSAWGAFLRSWKAWFQSMAGTFLGALFTLISFYFVHDWFTSNPPTPAALFLEIALLSLIWVGCVAACTAGPRMILPSIPVVLAATALLLVLAPDGARDAFTDLDKPFREADAWKNVPVNQESPAEAIRMVSSVPGLFRSIGWLVYTSVYVQVVFLIALPLLMMFVVPIPRALPPSARVRKVARMHSRTTPRLVPATWRKLRL